MWSTCKILSFYAQTRVKIQVFRTEEWVYTHSRSLSRFLGLIFAPETTPEKTLNIGDIRGSSRTIFESNLCPKNWENDLEWV